MALRNAFEGLATEAGQTEGNAQLAAIAGLQDEIRSLGETFLVGLQAILEKMPRVTGTDQVAVSIEAGSVGIASNQDLRTLTTLTTLSNMNQAGGQFLFGANLNGAGLSVIYNGLEIS